MGTQVPKGIWNIKNPSSGPEALELKSFRRDFLEDVLIEFKERILALGALGYEDSFTLYSSGRSYSYDAHTTCGAPALNSILQLLGEGHKMAPVSQDKHLLTS
jgi:hypothetical protein